MDVHLSQFPVPGWKLRASSLVSYAQFGTIAGVLFGEGLCRALGVPAPAFLSGPFLTEHRVPVLAGAWLGGGTISQSLLKTQAFEVYFDGTVVTSKLETGHMPRPDEILGGIRERLAKEEKEALGRTGGPGDAARPSQPAAASAAGT